MRYGVKSNDVALMLPSPIVMRYVAGVAFWKPVEFVNIFVVTRNNREERGTRRVSNVPLSGTGGKTRRLGLAEYRLRLLRVDSTRRRQGLGVRVHQQDIRRLRVDVRVQGSSGEYSTRI